MADKYYDLKIPFETLENSINQISDKIGYVEVSGNVLKFYDTKSTKKLLYSITLPSTINVIDSLGSTSTTDALSANKGKELSDALKNSVGKKGVGYNSEIFNNYSENTASSPFSHSEGCSNVEYSETNSHHGFLVIDRNVSEKTLTLTSSEGLEVGDRINFGIWGQTGLQLMESKLEILRINENIITVGSIHQLLFSAPLSIIFVYVDGKNIGNIISTGYGAHAENYGLAIGDFSHSEGFYSQSSGMYSHAEGDYTEARGLCAHSEGFVTRANVEYSHAEGSKTSIGLQGYSVASCDLTNNSFVLNKDVSVFKVGDIVSASDGKTVDYQYGTISAVDKTNRTITVSNASKLTTITTIIRGLNIGDVYLFGKGAHAEGYETIATSNFSHVMGKCNLVDAACKYAYIVGNGTGTAVSKRSNAHTLDWDGNAWYQGTVECTGIILTSPNGTKYKVTVTDSGTLTATAQSE